jgi:hypothetical protein
MGKISGEVCILEGENPYLCPKGKEKRSAPLGSYSPQAEDRKYP